MKQEDRWNEHYEEIMAFMQLHHRRPSKHRLEEHDMLNWIKYNKKLISKNKLSEERVERFNALLAMSKEVQRINQYAYTHSKELDLFQSSSSTS